MVFPCLAMTVARNCRMFECQSLCLSGKPGIFSVEPRILKLNNLNYKKKKKLLLFPLSDNEIFLLRAFAPMLASSPLSLRNML